MQIVAKALISGFISIVVALAAVTPQADMGLLAQATVDVRNVCVSLAAGASEEILRGNPVDIAVLSPFEMNISISGGSAVCIADGESYAVPLPSYSLPFEVSFSGEANLTVSDQRGLLSWW